MDARDKCNKITEIGKCAGCQKMTILIDHACPFCRDKFGPRCGIIFRKAREDKDFAIQFYQKLDNDVQRESFRHLFGDNFIDYEAALAGRVVEEPPKVAHDQSTSQRQALRLVDRS